MKTRRLVAVIASTLIGVGVVCAQEPPLKLLHSTSLQGVKKGFDHLAADPDGNRLFVCIEWNNSVGVFDLNTGKQIHTITGLARPHSIQYRKDINKLYIVDGTEEMGAVRIFDGASYKPLKTVNLFPDADWIAFDPTTKYLYVTQGGDVLKHSYSVITIVDTTAGSKVGDIQVDGEVIEDIALEASGTKMYLGNKTKNQVDVIDVKTRRVVQSWPLKLGNAIAPVALDEANHRLFVGCRSGQIVVLDTTTGKEIEGLPINAGVDDLGFDPTTKRLYANCAGPKGGGTGSIDIYEQVGADTYKSLGSAPTGPAARNGMLVPEVNKYYVAVPPHDAADATVQVYEVD